MNPILVIDDEEMYRKTISGVLRQSGYPVLQAESGEEGIEIMQNQPVDLIISDIMMDNLDGFRFIERIRMDPATSTVPLIFVTGLSDKETMRKGMTLGADDFLVKPFTGDELLAAVESRLAKRNQTAEQAERKLSQLRSSISLALPHEIRTPLASIIGFAEIIGDEGNTLTGPEITQYGKLMHKSGTRLLRMLENFTIFTQIEVIAADVEKLASLRAAHPLGTSVIVRTASRRKAEQYGRLADLELDLSEGDIAISEVHFDKICDELLDNAFKFSAPGSKVSVTTVVEKNDLVLTITDRGRGITSEQVASLGVYVQFDRTSHEQQGIGLGLTIAKRLTEVYGGRVEFDPGEEGGLRVRLHLPACTAMNSASPAARRSVHPRSLERTRTVSQKAIKDTKRGAPDLRARSDP